MGCCARLCTAVMVGGLSLAPAARGAEPIQPGANIGGCTLAFIFDGLGPQVGKVYATSAAHCFDGVDDKVVDAERKPIGRVVYYGDLFDRATDFVLVEILEEHEGRVDPAMRGHPDLPKGIATPSDLAVGDWLQMSGWGGLTSFNEDLREDRQALLTEFDDEVFNSLAPVSGGDSGGPIAHVDSGKALGIVSGWTFHRPGNLIGPTVSGVQAKLEAAGFALRMRLAGERPPQPPPPPAPPAQPAQKSEPPAKTRTKRKKKCSKKSSKRSKKGKKRCRRARR